MNYFDKWWNEFNISAPGNYEISEKDVRAAWGRCKKECLQILKKNAYIVHTSSEDYFGEFKLDIVDKKVIKQIEKL
jgi:hypothetical protein